MRHIALKVPLRAFAVVRRGQCGHAANARVQALGDALDDTALACGIAAFKQNHHLVAGGDHPVLQLDQLGLQAEQLAEVLATGFFLILGSGLPIRLHAGQHAVVHFHLQLFVIAVNHVAVHALHHVVVGVQGLLQVQMGLR